MKMKLTFLYKKRHILFWDSLIKLNRPNKIPKKSEMKKRGRGAEEMVAGVENIDIACASWTDNKFIS